LVLSWSISTFKKGTLLCCELVAMRTGFIDVHTQCLTSFQLLANEASESHNEKLR
jgi:hypothetical protein